MIEMNNLKITSQNLNKNKLIRVINKDNFNKQNKLKDKSYKKIINLNLVIFHHIIIIIKDLIRLVRQGKELVVSRIRYIRRRIIDEIVHQLKMGR